MGSKYARRELTNVARSIASICSMYLKKNLPETSSKFLKHEYYFYNEVLKRLQINNEKFNQKGLYDGDMALLDSPIRKITGKDSIILKYVNNSSYMALTETGLVGGLNESQKLQIKWETLVNAEIAVKKAFFSKDELIINGTNYSMDNADAKTEDWANYLNSMITAYKECVTNYPAYIQMIQSLPKFPKTKEPPVPYNIVHNPPKAVQPSAEPTLQVTERQDTKANPKVENSGFFSSFTSSIMSSSKTAFSKLKDVSTKASESIYASQEKINDTDSSKPALNKVTKVGSRAASSIFSAASNLKKGITPQPAAETTLCPACGEPVSPGKKFCGKCGTKIVTKPKILCPSCRAEVEEGMRFCGNCGAQIPVRQKIICPSCGAEIEDGKKFCGMCGAKVAVEQKKICPSCGTEIAAGQKFCGNCGTKV